MLFIQSDEQCETTYKDRAGKYQGQTGVTMCAHGQPLPGWHPLLSENAGSVKQAGISVAGRVVSEQLVREDDWEEHIVHWID